MMSLQAAFKEKEDMFDMEDVNRALVNNETHLCQILKLALEQRVSLHCFSAAYHYWIDMTSQRVPANLIQAQRDFFGAHTYQRLDGPVSEYYHTKWLL